MSIAQPFDSACRIDLMITQDGLLFAGRDLLVGLCTSVRREVSRRFDRALKDDRVSLTSHRLETPGRR